MGITGQQNLKIASIIIGICLLFFSQFPVDSQTLNGRGGYIRGLPKTLKKLPEIPPDEKEPKVILPSPDTLPEDESLSTVPMVYVKGFQFIGNTEIPDQELTEVSRGYINRKISTKELHELRTKLTRYYVDRGFINSGAVLPDQKVSKGIIVFQIIEGRLTDIDIIGTRRVPDALIMARLDMDPDKPLNIFILQQRLQLLHQDRLIKRVNGDLSPGLRPGESTLLIDVEEANPFYFTAEFANDSSPSSGSYGPEFSAGHLNLTGWGDALTGRYQHNEGVDEYYISYSVPVNLHNTRLSVFYDQVDSQIIEPPFDLIDISSETNSVGVSISHPFIKTLEQDLFVSLSGEKRKTSTFLFGDPFAFDENTENGKIKLTVGRLATDWTLYRPTQVFAVRSVISKGFDNLFDATSFDSEPDGDFITWLGQGQLAKRLDLIKGDQLILKTLFQKSNNPLPSMEKFSVGGRNSVRGYRENQFVRDEGLVLSVEYRMPLFRMPLPRFSKTLEDGIVQLAPFADWGRSWNKGRSADIISSVGAGIRWDPIPEFHVELYYGYGFQDITNPDHDLQDDGIHFYLKWDVF